MHSLSNPGTLPVHLKGDIPVAAPAPRLAQPFPPAPSHPPKNLTQAEEGGKAEWGEGGNSALVSTKEQQSEAIKPQTWWWIVSTAPRGYWQTTEELFFLRKQHRESRLSRIKGIGLFLAQQKSSLASDFHVDYSRFRKSNCYRFYLRNI